MEGEDDCALDIIDSCPLEKEPDVEIKERRDSNKNNIHLGDNANILSRGKEHWSKLKTTVQSANTVQKKKFKLDRGDSFLRKFSTRNQPSEKITESTVDFIRRGGTKGRKSWHFVIHPNGSLMFHWLALLTLSVLYNLWTCIAREAFREIQDGYKVIWFCTDALCDAIYLLDILMQFRTGYLHQGLMVYDSSKLHRNYMYSKYFVLDLVCLLPLDFLQFFTGIHPMIRFPRFLKLYRSFRFMHLYESRTAYPNLLRVANLSHILFLGSHWFAAFYYLISEAEGFAGGWSYPSPEGDFSSVTRKYLASLYWSTLTLTTIGDLPPPDTNWQYVFVIVSYLIGVFIFATIVGQVGNVITNRNASRQEFERLLDGAKFYMQTHNVPPDLQKRVQRWYDYVWLRGRLNCNDINSLGLLPDKLKTELALHVNLETLKKVTIFQKCRPEFLHDLMLKMRAYIFTPGDLICRRGEVAREMFIIADGVVEIIGECGTVLTQMSTGDFFGEIGILNLDGGINRRTADVRSVGYSELFVLSREDVLAALKDHPDAECIIREFGQKRLREIEEHRRQLKSPPPSPDPKELKTLLNKHSSGKSFKRSQNSKVSQPSWKRFSSINSPLMKGKFSFKGRKRTRSEGKSQSDETCLNSKLNQTHGTPDEDLGSLHNDGFVNSSLGIIQERGGSLSSNRSVLEERETHFMSKQKMKSCQKLHLADIVLSVLKRRKQQDYELVDTDDKLSFERESVFSDIGSTQSCADVTPLTADVNTDSSADMQLNCDNQIKFPYATDSSSNTLAMHDMSKTNTLTPSPRITLPTILLTKDESNATESDDQEERHSPSPTRQRSKSTNFLNRKFSERHPRPKHLDLPHDGRMERRISLPPPLDAPVDFSHLPRIRGLSQVPNFPSTNLAEIRDFINRRISDMEGSYRENLERLERSSRQQDMVLQTILRQIQSLQQNIQTSSSAASNFSETTHL